MSMANIPNITPIITITEEDAINLIIASIALEEIALSHIINAEGEKIQYILGTLPGTTPPGPVTVNTLLQVNKSVQDTLNAVLTNELLLAMKLKNILPDPC